MNSPDQSLATRKEELDVSRIFLAYLSAGGDTVAAAQIAGCRIEDVLFLAKAECWDVKLQNAGVVRGRTKDEAQIRLREINRMTAYIQAIRLRGLIDLTLQYIYKDQKNIVEFASETDKHGETFFSTKPILDLTKAASEVHAMIYRSLGDVLDGEAGKVSISNIKDLHLTVVQAMADGGAAVPDMLKKATPAESAHVKPTNYIDIPAGDVMDEPPPPVT